jgi:predicted exporter
MPLKPTDEAVFRSIAEEFDYVHFVNKAKDIGRDLDTLTKTMLLFFLAAFVVVSIIICFVYPWPDNLKICIVPLIIVMSAVAALTANGISIGFFSVAALVLVFGLGLDYIFYMTGKKSGKKNLTLLGVVLSFLTTILSFGALALSSFAPVHIFGLTVFAGLGAAFISAVFLQARDD